MNKLIIVLISFLIISIFLVNKGSKKEKFYYPYWRNSYYPFYHYGWYPYYKPYKYHYKPLYQKRYWWW